MKKTKILLLSLILVSFFACDKDDANVNNVYDNVNGQTLISFQGNSSDLAVTIDDVGSVDITVEASTVSSSDRTVSISIDPESTANPENYSLSSTTITIPANEYFGSVTINGVDNSVDTTAETIILNIDSTSEASTLGTSTHTVNIFQVCPVPSDYFVGSYLIEQMTPQIDGYSLSHGSVVEVYIPAGASSTVRAFQTEAYITYCSGSFFEFRVNMVCNEFIVPSQNTTCACGNFSDWWSAATTPDTYDIGAGDDVLFVTFTDDTQADCGTPAQTQYRFTKQ